MSSILLISGHPNLDASVANQTIVETVASELGAQLTVRRLDQLYRNRDIDVQAEQQALEAADMIIWQFPFHWYAMPALMKRWLDEVFLYGWAHGSQFRLAGKKIILSFTTGAPFDAYQHGQAMNNTVDAFLTPLQQTIDLCRIEWLAPVYSNGMMTIPNVSTAEDIARVKAKAIDHANQLVAQLRTTAQAA
ncbi:Putative NADPH-quinone reductase (modulator of drug activity B) [Acinetobacter marinus]|uniref:NADPH-quinone reductase (Modulator of drug activity B) n=1 Tax=Acinetobacter marinus TaxID=281375 RepID=A0A1G6IJD9_9GAMM|nr:NAD(P)H-dependent oxidoreductase [Acinetobacter marinus]SDC06702.1 Putative NADPH-quinone reductase (modulator of drug activity B) [Acinetobacter marinus]